jgi:hypothetical protein
MLMGRSQRTRPVEFVLRSDAKEGLRKGRKASKRKLVIDKPNCTRNTRADKNKQRNPS